VTEPLHVHRYGPDGPLQVLAIHGLTGHGRRWETLATKHLPGVAIAGPDLLGHGRSSWSAPWTIDANVAALVALLEDSGNGPGEPVVVVAHSFGGAIALSLAAARPDLVSALLLLDPAVELDGSWMHEIAESMLASPDYTDRDEARDEKISGSWADVALSELDADVDEHLVALPNGRVGWRICIPAMMSYWSELARETALPPDTVATTVVRAAWTSPPYVNSRLINALREQLGDRFTLLEFECDHMVPHAKPDETAELIRTLLGR